MHIAYCHQSRYNRSGSGGVTLHMVSEEGRIPSKIVGSILDFPGAGVPREGVLSEFLITPT